MIIKRRRRRCERRFYWQALGVLPGQDQANLYECDYPSPWLAAHGSYLHELVDNEVTPYGQIFHPMTIDMAHLLLD